MKDNTNLVLDTIKNTIIKNEMIDETRKVLVAVSGGADSICLLHSLYKLMDELKIKLYAAHLNHCIRGEEAEHDENFVREFCESLKIPAYFKRVEVEKLAEQNKLTVEECGREERYKFFSEVCEKNNIGRIATAHNRNDLSETVLMRIIRGTGLDGLVGIKYVREDGVIRPLLDVERSLIESYCEENNITYCTDSTNADNDYTRNKVRNELIPYLRDNFNPKIMDSLANLSANVSQDARFINDYSERLYNQINNPLPSHKPHALHIESMKFIEVPILTRLIRQTIKKCLNADVTLEKKHIEEILTMLDKDTGFGIDLPSGLRCEVQYGWLVFKNQSECEQIKSFFDEDFYTDVDINRAYEIESFNKTVKFRVEESTFKLQKGEIALDFDLLDGRKLSLRNRRKGDKIVRFKDGREKKLKSVFIDMKIPRDERDSIPLLCADDEIVGIVGVIASEKYKFSGFKNNKRALVISFEECKN